MSPCLPHTDVNPPTLEFNLAERCVRRGGLAIDMTPREWILIDALLMPNAHIWAEPELAAFLARSGVVSSHNAIRIHLCNIRRKLGWEAIQTLPGRGYRMVAPMPVASA
jgi:two-component system, OmpR family, response regulator